MTSKELLNCLKDRPCSVCKFRDENGCHKWKCVFEEPTDDSVLEDIKAEIDKQEFTHHKGLTHWYMTPSEVKSVVFEIIDKYIGKAESEGEE